MTGVSAYESMRVGAAKNNVFGLKFIVFARLKCIEIVLPA